MRKITKKFRTASGDVTVLKSIDATFQPGEFVGVIGKSGSGKTTLVNMLTGIDRPTSGEVQVGDTFVHKMNESDMSRWRGLNLGIVFQFYQLLPVLSLLENTMLPMDIAGQIPAAERESRAISLLKLVGLEDVAHKLPAAVSGGQQQTAAIARALANDPPFLIADEPTGNLDSRTAENIFHIFEGLVDQGKTIIMVTHDPQLARRTSRTVLLSDGEIIHPAIAAGLHWLNHSQLLSLTHQSREFVARQGEQIIAPGQVVDELYLVATGRVETTTANGKRAARLESGKPFGQVALLSGKPSAGTATAMEETLLVAVKGAAIRDLASTNPVLRSGLLKPDESLV